MYKIAKENLASLFALIHETNELYLPVQVAGQTNFAAWTEDARVDLDTLKTVKSPKDVFFPQSETLYTCNKEENKLKITPEALVDAPLTEYSSRIPLTPSMLLAASTASSLLSLATSPRRAASVRYSVLTAPSPQQTLQPG